MRREDSEMVCRRRDIATKSDKRSGNGEVDISEHCSCIALDAAAVAYWTRCRLLYVGLPYSSKPCLTSDEKPERTTRKNKIL